MPVETDFRALMGFAPLSWQKRLYREHFADGRIPLAVDVPTGLGKTATMALWLIARAHGAPLPRRLVYVVDRRAVVDQATDEAEKLREAKMARGFLLKELADLTQLKGKDREHAEADLVGRTLVVASALGGLSKDGMLDDDWREPPSVLDEGWSEEVLSERFGYRVIGPGVSEPDAAIWKRDTAVPLTEPQDSDDEEAGEELRVYVARGRAAAHEGDPAVARRRQLLDAHHEMAAEAARKLAAALELPEPYRIMLDWVARHHDLGKDRHLWRSAMGAPPTGPAYAKTERGDGRRLNGYRHEFGSLGDVERTGALAEIEHLGSDICELALHLIASHHGYARPVIKVADPSAPPSALDERARAVALRFARLQRRWGPWGLAWWEALLRAADVQASRANDAGDGGVGDGTDASAPRGERGARAAAEG